MTSGLVKGHEPGCHGNRCWGVDQPTQPVALPVASAPSCLLTGCWLASSALRNVAAIDGVPSARHMSHEIAVRH